LADVNAVEVGKIPIEDDQVRSWFAATADQTCCTIGSDINVVAFDVELEAEQFGQPWLVIDDQNTTSWRGLFWNPDGERSNNLDMLRGTAARITKISPIVLSDGPAAVLDGGFDPSTA
jgi:hypothetical protein